MFCCSGAATLTLASGAYRVNASRLRPIRRNAHGVERFAHARRKKATWNARDPTSPPLARPAAIRTAPSSSPAARASACGPKTPRRSSLSPRRPGRSRSIASPVAGSPARSRTPAPGWPMASASTAASGSRTPPRASSVAVPMAGRSSPTPSHTPGPTTAGPVSRARVRYLRAARRHLHAGGHLDGGRPPPRHLADLGVTCIEMMPIAEFRGRFGWGYDGALPWAPSALYGAPDDLRAFIDAAHRHRDRRDPRRRLQPLRAGQPVRRVQRRLVHRPLQERLGRRSRL